MKHTIFFFAVCILICSIGFCNHHKHGKKEHHVIKQSQRITHHNSSKYQPNASKESDITYVVIREAVAVVGLILCLAGSRIIKITMFMGGFILLFVFAYITLPSIVDNETCCGPKGKWIARMGVCFLIAILGGLLTLFVYYVGIFAIGGIFGMICALLALSTPLAEKEFFDSAMSVGLFYGGFIVVGGITALLLQTVAVAAATSLGGSYAVFWGVDYFAETNFSGGIEVLIVQIQDYIRNELGLRVDHGHHPNFWREYTLKDIVIFTFFVLLSMMGFSLQIYLAKSDVKLKTIKDGSCKGNQCECNKRNSDILTYLRSLHTSKESVTTKETIHKP